MNQASRTFNDPTPQRCQLALSTLETAALMPSCASEITSLPLRRPRRVSLRKNAVQKVSASEALIYRKVWLLCRGKIFGSETKFYKSAIRPHRENGFVPH